jgi:hypothetical protein
MIRVPPDSTGKTVETNSPNGADQRQVVSLGDTVTAANVLSISATGAAKVDGSAVTQPVSIASMPSTPVTGTFWQATQPVSGTFWQATQPVSGTFWQATQPVSIASMPSTPVTGTFWQATQPISGTVTAIQATGTNLHVVVDSAPTTAVTGTFWQATQPVSGTFWQATQPISGTVTATQATGTNLHVVVDTAPTTAVTGTFFQVTQPVSATALPLPANAAQETGNLATIATLMAMQNRIVDLLEYMSAQLAAINLNLAQQTLGGTYVDPSDIYTTLQ